MERYRPLSAHSAYLNSRNFERQLALTQALGLDAADYQKATVLYLTEGLLEQEITRLNQLFANPGRRFTDMYLPGLHRFIHGFDLRRLDGCNSAISQTHSQLVRVYRRLPSPDGIAYATRLKDSLKAMRHDGVIRNNGFRLEIADEDIASIAKYKVI